MFVEVTEEKLVEAGGERDWRCKNAPPPILNRVKTKIGLK